MPASLVAQYDHNNRPFKALTRGCPKCEHIIQSATKFDGTVDEREVLLLQVYDMLREIMEPGESADFLNEYQTMIRMHMTDCRQYDQHHSSDSGSSSRSSSSNDESEEETPMPTTTRASTLGQVTISHIYRQVMDRVIKMYFIQTGSPDSSLHHIPPNPHHIPLNHGSMSRISPNHVNIS